MEHGSYGSDGFKRIEGGVFFRRYNLWTRRNILLNPEIVIVKPAFFRQFMPLGVIKVKVGQPGFLQAGFAGFVIVFIAPQIFIPDALSIGEPTMTSGDPDHFTHGFFHIFVQAFGYVIALFVPEETKMFGADS